MPTTIPGNLIFQSPTNNDPLLDLNTQPSLDLQFAASKTLDDRVSGLPLVDHQRDVSSGESAGTYVGSDGLIKTSAANLFTYSEEFDNVAWAPSRIDISANVTASPTGTFTADQLTVNSGGSFAYLRQSESVDNGSTTTISVWAKYVNCRYIWLLGGESPNVFAYFDLINGTVGSTNGYVCSIEDSGNGWYRCSATITKTDASGTEEIGLGLTRTDNNATDNAVGDSVLIWGAQLEEGSTASPYIKTTTLPSAAPRFDHDPVTGESLGLLIEESRTNLFTYSSLPQATTTSFPTGWGGWNPLTCLTSQTLSPDGVAYGVFHGAINSNGGGLRKDITGLTPGGTYYVSYYVKGLTAEEVTYFTNNNAVGTTTGTSGGAQDNAWFAATKVQFSCGNLYGTGASGGSAITLTTEWQRSSGVITADNAGSARFIIGNNVSDVGTGNEDGGGTWMIWGAQLEAGSFPTSYIPTTSSAVTRAADVTSITGSNFSSWYNQSEGTVFTEADGEGSRIVGLNDGTDSNRQELFQSGNNVFCFQKNANVNEVNISIAAEDKSVFAYKANDYSVTSSGGSVVTDTSATPPTVNQMSIGNWYNDTGQLNGTISRLTYYPYRLPDATLQEITS